MPRTRHAFTLTELLVALGVGMIVLNAAFVVFINTGKFFKRIESVGTRNEIAQSMLMWALTQRDPGQYPQPSTLPANDADPPQLTDAENGTVPQFRRIGAARFVEYPASGDRYLLCAIRDYTNYRQSGSLYMASSAAKPVLQPVYLVIPSTKN